MFLEENNRLLVKARFGDEIHYIEEFIRPNEYMVRELYKKFANLGEEEKIFALWDWVCRNIAYPLTYEGIPDETHILKAFKKIDIPIIGSLYMISYTSDEFFQFPSETITWRIGDCDDSSILLCSLLRNFLSPEEVYAVIGRLDGNLHAWVSCKGTILETTLEEAPVNVVIDPTPYYPVYIFNDVLYYKVGSSLGIKNEIKKLRRISEIWNCKAKGGCYA